MKFNVPFTKLKKLSISFIIYLNTNYYELK